MNKKFKKKQTDLIKNIGLESNTWKDKIYITLDVDWAHDDIIIYTIGLIEKYDLYATWYITHDTPILARLRENPKFELGIHPNFNPLLIGSDSKGKDFEEVAGNMLGLVPEAKSVRSHSMTQNSRILDAFARMGLSHDCNHFIPYESDINIKPWKLWNDMIKCPYHWEDDIEFTKKNTGIIDVFKKSCLNIYDFHPIHIYLNTENTMRYEQTRNLHTKPEELLLQRYNNIGTRSYFIELLENCK
jgi:hypothetical protein